MLAAPFFLIFQEQLKVKGEQVGYLLGQVSEYKEKLQEAKSQAASQKTSTDQVDRVELDHLEKELRTRDSTHQKTKDDVSFPLKASLCLSHWVGWVGLWLHVPCLTRERDADIQGRSMFERDTHAYTDRYCLDRCKAVMNFC